MLNNTLKFCQACFSNFYKQGTIKKAREESFYIQKGADFGEKSLDEAKVSAASDWSN